MKQIVCLSSEPWSAVPTRTQQLMTRMRDAEVLFFEPPAPIGSRGWKAPGKKLRPNLIAYTLPPELAQDTPLQRLDRLSTRRTLRFLRSKLERHRFSEPLLWCDSPAGAQYLEELPFQGVVYDCGQSWPAYAQAWERDLAAQADVVFAASPELAQRLLPYNPNVTLLPYGCSYPMFAQDAPPRPEALRQVRGPIFGFMGTLWPDLDLTAAVQALRAVPGATLVLVGRNAGCVQLPGLLRRGNVLAVGPVPPVDLPDYLGSFDVCFHLLRQGRDPDGVISPRLFEYLSSGKPIVAMLRPEQVEHFPDVVYGAHTPGEFAQLCARALNETGSWARDRRREYGKAASWSQRSELVNQILESTALLR